MRFEEKIERLRSIIYQSLDGLVNGDFVLWGVPLHGNIGDVMIWKGETDYLSRLPFQCLEVVDSISWVKRPLDKSTVILLQGGGNWGDLYRKEQEIRLEVVKEYPDNRIVIFPQSVWYEDESLIFKDETILESHRDLWICLRDNYSYDFIRKHFPRLEHVLLVPDMAFCIGEDFIAPYRLKTDKKALNLYLRRSDKEFDALSDMSFSLPEWQTMDWPTLGHRDLLLTMLLGANRIRKSLPEGRLKSWLTTMFGQLVQKIILERLPNIGCRFIAGFDQIITTRLHVLIVCVLLHKPVRYIDNMTGKLSSFTNTWLKDLDMVEQI